MVPALHRHRRQALAAGLPRAGLDALLVTHGVNVRYLTGFSGSNGWLVVQRDRASLLTDPRYCEQAPRQAHGVPVRIAREGLADSVPDAIGTDKARVGFEAAHLSYAAVQELQQIAPTIDWVPTREQVESLRACKSSGEVVAIERALQVAETAIDHLLCALRPGTTELQLAAQLEAACRSAGAEAMAFPTIVASGAHAAQPHAWPRQQPIGPESLVLVDLGCVLGGYCSDITRMAWFGTRCSSRWLDVVECVRGAIDAALERVAPGTPVRDVDAAARRCLADAGLEEAFIHGLGHGVGLEVHEAPRVSQRSDEVLRPGMVITLEPGVYLPGEGGVRVEQMVLVTEQGGRVLNRMSSRLVHIESR